MKNNGFLGALRYVGFTDIPDMGFPVLSFIRGVVRHNLVIRYSPGSGNWLRSTSG